MRTKYEFIQELKERRVFKVRDGVDGKYYVIKKPRAESSEHESISLVNELICSSLGDRLRVPVAQTRLVKDQGVVWLCRPWFEKIVCEQYEMIGSDRFVPDPRYNCTHFWTVREPYVDWLQKSDLKAIMAFDQWVWALDRVPHNVVVDQNERVKVIDYEHSLNLGTGGSYPRHYLKSCQVPYSMRRCHPTQMSHGVGAQSQIQEVVDSIEGLNRNEIEDIVLNTTEEILDCQQRNGKKVNRESVRSNSTVIVKLLLNRLRNLRILMGDLFDGWREVVERNRCQL